MLPKTNNNGGGTIDGAMSGAGECRDIALAGDVQAICVSLATIAVAGCTLAFGAPHLWSFLLAR